MLVVKLTCTGVSFITTQGCRKDILEKEVYT